jgi:hypothetical protein
VDLSLPHYHISLKVIRQTDVNELSKSHPTKDYLGQQHYIQQLHFHGQIVPICVPSIDQLVNIFKKPLSKTTITSLWNHIGVGDMVLKGDYMK